MLNENVTSGEIDLTYLSTVSGGDKAFEVELIQSLTAEINQRLQAIETAAFISDKEAIRLQAHSLKNLYAMLGLQSLQKAAFSIETNYLAMTQLQIQELVKKGGREWVENKIALEKIIASYQATVA